MSDEGPLLQVEVHLYFCRIWIEKPGWFCELHPGPREPDAYGTKLCEKHSRGLNIVLHIVGKYWLSFVPSCAVSASASGEKPFFSYLPCLSFTFPGYL